MDRTGGCWLLFAQESPERFALNLATSFAITMTSFPLWPWLAAPKGDLCEVALALAALQQSYNYLIQFYKVDNFLSLLSLI